MTHHFKIADSIFNPADPAFADSGTDTSLLLDAGAYLISEIDQGVFLTGDWTATVNGEIGTFEVISTGLLVTGAAHVMVGKTGEVFGGTGITAHGLTLTNFGFVGANINGGLAVISLGVSHVTNAGTMQGNIEFSGVFDDAFTDFKKIGKVVKNGSVAGVIDLGDGDDHFFGGSHAETVRDNKGADTILLGGGNDTYIALGGGPSDGNDAIDGGNGKGDLYDASTVMGRNLLINLDSVVHTDVLAGPANTAVGKDIDSFFGRDTITGFENASGADGNDSIFGNASANVLTGNDGFDGLFGYGGNDHLIGGAGADNIFGGRGADLLEGGADPDTFNFLALSDSTVAAKGRDTIVGFTVEGVPAVDDVLNLSGIDAIAKTKSVNDAFNLTADAGFGGFTHHAGELNIHFSGNNTIVAGDVTGDGKADFSILLTGQIFLQDTSFVF